MSGAPPLGPASSFRFSSEARARCAAARAYGDDEPRGSYKPDFGSRKEEKVPVAAAPASAEEDDDAMSYFQKLAES